MRDSFLLAVNVLISYAELIRSLLRPWAFVVVYASSAEPGLICCPKHEACWTWKLDLIPRQCRISNPKPSLQSLHYTERIVLLYLPSSIFDRCHLSCVLSRISHRFSNSPTVQHWDGKRHFPKQNCQPPRRDEAHRSGRDGLSSHRSHQSMSPDARNNFRHRTITQATRNQTHQLLKTKDRHHQRLRHLPC